MLYLTPSLVVQRGTYDLVMLAKKAHERIVTQFLCLSRRVAKVSEEDRSNR
jgi:hypothetical protein